VRKGVAAVGLAVAVVLLGGWEPLRSPDADAERGDELFAAGDFDEAGLAYRRALRRRGDDPALHFNLGAALYEDAVRKIGDERERLFSLAERSFRIATDAGDSALRVTAYYNLGNTLYQTGRFDQAVAAYRRVLRLRPGDRDARHNLELALRAARDRQRGANGDGDPSPAAPDESPGDRGPDREGDDGQGADGSDRGGASGQPETGDGGERGPNAETGPRREDEAPRMPPAKFMSRSDRDRKLDQLERQSRRVRTTRLREQARGVVREAAERDW